VKAIVLETDTVPELSYPMTVTGLAGGSPAMSTLIMEKTPLANSMVEERDVATAPRRGDGGAGMVRLASQPSQIKPLYVVMTSLSVRSSKLIAPINTKTSVPVPVPEVPLALLLEDLEDLVVGALVDFGPLVDFRVGDLVDLTVEDLVDLVVGDLVDFRVGDLVDLTVEELRLLASWTSAVPLEMTERRRNSVFMSLADMVKEIDVSESESKLWADEASGLSSICSSAR
jgi:hypothetical protein